MPSTAARTSEGETIDMTNSSSTGRLSAVKLAVLALAMAAGLAPSLALAQYRDNDDRGYNDRQDNDRRDDDQQSAQSDYDDGSYSSDKRGYSDEDDEDGYEDGQDAPDVSYFYDELEDEGTWISSSEYGQVWRPRRVDADWRPYTRGTWANTEEHGWYWVSDEPFGWATYHYGRWHNDDRHGWVWVPGTRWGPAWVAWRSNDEHIGWAPLPPESRWDHGSGLTVSATLYEGPRYSSYWSFVEPRYITTPRIYTFVAPPARNITIINITRPQTNYIFINRRIVNRGVSVTNIERVTRTRVTTVRVNASDNRAYRNGGRASNQVNNQGGQINVFRPKLTRVGARPRPAGRAAVERNQFRDVDRRPARQDRAARQRQLQQQGAPAVNRAPNNVNVIPPNNGRPAGVQRDDGPNPNANRNFQQGANRERALENKNERQERIRERNQQFRANRAARQQQQQQPGARQSGQVQPRAFQNGGPPAQKAQGQGPGQAEATAARKRQQVLQQQRQRQNQQNRPNQQF